ncbi:MAG: type II toxin-antitoxin system mRNA interferase toxin, RelE/StbE family [Timaviella obliquedivisa GSE-PSE-MK23-08B]|jgi:addiction module RelE/StbE family toxin|nr:type II toxin-antitoxin system mRNA interferase toxin, RelE/StbE family [Timaviella obliquedivisa GSE-PSE-MK23-08B]
MRTVIWEEGFRRAFKRLIKKQPSIQVKVITVLECLADNPFDPSLRTHKLKGELKDLWACTVEYDCRIIFSFQEIVGETESALMMIDIGRHDDVY